MDSPVRLTGISIEGLRSLAEVHLLLPSGQPTVLIGENASGKSSLLEALELLRLASEPYFFRHFHERHGGLASLLRVGTSQLKLVAHFEGQEADATVPRQIRYTLALGREGPYTRIYKEHLWLTEPGQPPVQVIARGFSDAKVTDLTGIQHDWPTISDGLLLALLGAEDGGTSPHPAIQAVARCLRQIQVQLPVDVTPTWVGRQINWESPLRRAMTVSPTDRLSIKGHNLVNALFALQQAGDDRWERTIALVRQGLGQDVEKILLKPDAGGGALGLWLRYTGLAEPVPAVALSDGTLAWLAMVALHQLARGDSGGGALAMDEPETHFHPGLLVRAMDLFQDLARTHPVVLATHSDQLLDALRDPAASVVVCELDPKRATRLRRLDREALSRWLTDYVGFGELRREGYAQLVLGPVEPAS